MNIDNKITDFRLNEELDEEKILPMEEIELRTISPKKTASKKIRKPANKTIKRKRRDKGSRRNPKTKRCNKKCLPSHKRNPRTKRCVLRKKRITASKN